MPNRILKESICYSNDLDQLTPFEETVFYRLIVRVDDYGRIDARPSFLKSTLFVTKQGVTERNIKEAVARMASLGLVRLYEVDGKSFLMFPKWHLHQRVRDSKERYPAPPEEVDEQENSISPQVAASCGESPPESNPIRIQSISCSPDGERIIIDDIFERTYELYPRKEGKAKGKISYRLYLKGDKTIGKDKYRLNHEQIFFAIQKYRDVRRDQDPQFNSRFDSFMNGPVLDYVEMTKPYYEAYMLEEYGEEWQEVRFEYV